jgi:cysteine desulfuration protein SufE
MMLENILADFELLDDWEDRYRYVIELGRSLPPLPEAARAEANKMRVTIKIFQVYNLDKSGDRCSMAGIGDFHARQPSRPPFH